MRSLELPPLVRLAGRCFFFFKDWTLSAPDSTKCHAVLLLSVFSLWCVKAESGSFTIISVVFCRFCEECFLLATLNPRTLRVNYGDM